MDAKFPDEHESPWANRMGLHREHRAILVRLSQTDTKSQIDTKSQTETEHTHTETPTLQEGAVQAERTQRTSSARTTSAQGRCPRKVVEAMRFRQLPRDIPLLLTPTRKAHWIVAPYSPNEVKYCVSRSRIDIHGFLEP